MRRRREAEVEEKILEVDASMQGSMVFKDPVNLKINGSFEGDLITRGVLTIGSNATIKANINGEKVTIAGKVNGDITASGEVNLLNPARVMGNIKTPSLSMERGVFFQGNCQMLREGAQTNRIDGASEPMTSGELAAYLEVEEVLIADWASSGKLPGNKKDNKWVFDRSQIDEWIANERVK